MQKLWLHPASEATPRQPPVVVNRSSNRCEDVAVTVMHMEKMLTERALEKTRVTSASSRRAQGTTTFPLGLTMVLGPYGLRFVATLTNIFGPHSINTIFAVACRRAHLKFNTSSFPLCY